MYPSENTRILKSGTVLAVDKSWGFGFDITRSHVRRDREERQECSVSVGIDWFMEVKYEKSFPRCELMAVGIIIRGFCLRFAHSNACYQRGDGAD